MRLAVANVMLLPCTTAMSLADNWSQALWSIVIDLSAAASTCTNAAMQLQLTSTHLTNILESRSDAELCLAVPARQQGSSGPLPTTTAPTPLGTQALMQCSSSAPLVSVLLESTLHPQPCWASIPFR